MEIIIIIAILIGLIWWFFLRTPADVTVVSNKVETAPVAAPAVVAATVELAPAVVTATVVVAETVVETAPVAESAPVVEASVKKPRKPRAPKAVVETVKVAAKKADLVKKAAAIKTTTKARSKKV